jgi:shikimate dehydrogenase
MAATNPPASNGGSAGFRAACVIGWPAGHSRSPLIHNYWIAQHGIAGEYRKEAVRPEEFEAFLADLSGRGYAGANVTLPHKEMALALTRADARARTVGAANTLWYEGGALHSTNTDVEGFLANLDAAAPGWERGLEAALVLGAGGSARAVVFGLIERGVPRIHVANRTLERAEALRARFGDTVVPVGWDAVGALLPAAGLLVNTTSLGMKGQPPLTLDIARLRDGAVVADLVYVPLVTGLIGAAKARGLQVADGLGMLLHQATRPFEKWFGVRPQVTPDLRSLVEADLARS